MGDKKVFQVSEFNEFIDIYLNQVDEVVVEGEISRIDVSQNKWIFATIKDKESSVDIFSSVFKIPSPDLLEAGMLVQVYGKPSLYKKTGRFSITAERIMPAGEGALRLAFEKLKAKLEKEGLFDRKRPLPMFPEKIGLLTARGSRAYSDFVKVLENRAGGIKIYFYPVTVQGNDSVESITAGFKYFNATHPNLDLLVLTRGGGSLEDLQSFNDERVARAVFSSKPPVVCGVGHEEDLSIADLVADVRASTPSNAAELIVRTRTEVLKAVDFSLKTMEAALKQLIRDKSGLILKNVSSLSNALAKETTHVHLVISRFNTAFAVFRKEVVSFTQITRDNKKQLLKATGLWIRPKKEALEFTTRLLLSLDFRKVLERGFSITTDKSGKVLKSAKRVRKGESITTSLIDGKIGSQIVTVEKE
ncbi:exodeoxyribonuclease VII large subunit [Patescibacteria group bacterium]|nr:exodeoxyribonuclease VII large subunit [Patescibacteria group bacterium]